MRFEELNLNNNVLDALYDMHFDTCTPVQEKCIPEILKGRDVMGIAQTGTGKTAAYLLPILSKIDSGHYPEDAINCLIMSPTRELAQQIDQAMQGFGYYLNGVSSVAVYGGNDGNRYDQEVKSLRLGADVVIATPGRLISHINMGNIDMSKISFFVLDEADRMLDMGFSEDIMTIAKELPKNCQTIMFSATMPDKINELARTLLKNPVEIKLAISKPAEKIKQRAFVCYEKQKLKIIQDIFKRDNLKRIIVFCGSKQKVKQVTGALQRMKVNCGEMHSDLDQAQRDEVMLSFKGGHIDVLVATDIVARGIDIDDIAMVINYDVPHDAEDYVHRIGRTARADKDGQAITLVSKDDIYHFQQIEKFLENEVEKAPLPAEFGEVPEYISGEKPQRHRASAKSVRRKNRDQTAHKHKPRRTNNDENAAAQTSRNNVERAEQKYQQSRNNQQQRKSRYNKERQQEGYAQANTNEQVAAANEKRQQSRNNRQRKQYSPANTKQENNKQRNQRNVANEPQTSPRGKDNKQWFEQQNKHSHNKQRRGKKLEPQFQPTRKFDAPKTQSQHESGFAAIIKKPLRWFRALTKK